MKKRIAIALAAALMTVSSLSACGSSDNSSSTDSQSGGSTSSSSDSEASSGDASADPAAEAIAARTEPQTIVVNWPTYSGTLDGIDRIVEKMNELTIPALNLQVEMQITDFANRTQSVTLSISGGEQIDIISSISVGYTNGIAKDYWEDLEQEVDGYNLLEEDVELVITATTANGQTWDGVANTALTALTVTVDGGEERGGVLTDGTVAVTVANNQGATLPETGGMGTTLFYIIGGVLVVAAVVVLVARRRAGGREE